MTFTDLCRKTRNWFDKKRHFGTFNLDGDLDFACEGQFYRLIGDCSFNEMSAYVDGVCLYESNKFRLNGEEDIEGILKGAIWEMSVPPDFTLLYVKMSEWETKNVDVLNSPFQSESFGNYSRSLKTGNNGSLTVWDNFASDLARWQKI